MPNVDLTQRLQNLMPQFYGAKVNPNWIGILTAIGESDQNTANLIASVAEQFFVKTASRPYLDRLGANVDVQRPRLVGMDDPTFRQYIPILSYKPKQVKAIMDSLLDLFFFKESTTAYMISTQASPYVLQDGWELEYTVDNIHDEYIVFHTADFTNIAAATAQEIVSTINRQAQFSFAVVNNNVVTNITSVEIFTKTIGSKGSLQMVGGRANIALQFPGFLVNSGNGANTQWLTTKIGDLMTFTWIGGQTPNVNLLQVGNIVIISGPVTAAVAQGNVGWFVIENVDIATNSFSFRNLLGVAGTFTETSPRDVKFINPEKLQVFLNEQRAVVWQVEPDQVVIEMPTSPPIVKRQLQGSAHINGLEATMTAYNSPTSATMNNLTGWPATGNFFLQEEEELMIQLPNTPVTFTATFGTSSTTLNLTSVTDLLIGQVITDTTIPGNFLAGTFITGVNGTIITINQPTLGSSVANPGDTITSSASVTVQDINTRLQYEVIEYTYASITGNTMNGITPDLPALSSLNEFSLSSLSRTSNVGTAVTSIPNDYVVGDYAIITGAVSGASFTSTFTSGVSTIVASSTAGLLIGQTLSDITNPTNLAAGTRITSIVGFNIGLSLPTTGVSSGDTISSSIADSLLGTFLINNIVNDTTFQFATPGVDGSESGGTVRVEQIGMSPTGSVLILNTSQLHTGILGPYIWDEAAPFVLSSLTADIKQMINAGDIVRTLQIGANNIPNAPGLVIFDYGTSSQEGPIRYLYKPSADSLAIDPSYIFQFNHAIGSAVTLIDNKGPHVINGTEYAPYITDPSVARIDLEQLIISVGSVGIFIDFLIRYPEQFYSEFNVYDNPNFIPQ